MMPLLRADLNRPLVAFYAYSAACGVFSCISTGLFMPIFLEQLARSHGRMEPLRSDACDNAPADALGGRCSVSVMGMWVDTASYSLYTKSINVALQAITLISISVLADIPKYRNRLLLSFATLGSSLATLFLLIPTQPRASLYISALLCIVSSVCLSDSYVCLNAFLPELARGETERIGREEGREGYSAAGSPLPGEGTALIRAVARTSTEIMDLSSVPTVFRDPNPDDDDDDYHIISQSPSPPAPSSATYNAQTLKLSIISSRGIAISFLSGVTLLSLSLIPILLTHGSLKALRSVIGTSGLVWLSITGVVWLLLRRRGNHSRVSVTMPETRGGGGVDDFPGIDGAKDDSWDIVKQKVWEGWARVGMLINGEEIRRLRVTYWYLLASALLQDAFNTTLAVSILFAKTTLSMSPAQVIVVGLLMQLTAVLSSSFTPAIQKRYALTGIQSILVCVAMGTGMCVYGMIGLVCPWFGMRNSWEMYLCAIWFGMLYGPYDSIARSVLVDFIPPGQEARFFSLFSITDKSASFLGPAAIAAVADSTGEIRYGFGVLALLMVVPVPILLYFVDVERGRKDSRSYSTR